MPFVAVDDLGQPIDPIHRYLRDFLACGNRSSSVRSYAYVLMRWWRFLVAVGVDWDRATPAEGRDFVLWMMQARKSVAGRRTLSARTVGRTNPVTRKRYQGDGYQPRTVRHSNAVVHAFYQFWIDQGAGPLLNPMPLRRDSSGGRLQPHHNPLEPFRAVGRLRYNPPVPRQKPRAMPGALWEALFTALRSNRDRALLALAISTAARAWELLGLRSCDIDWAEQLIRVRRKGSDAEQWLVASADAFVWLRLYLDEVGLLGPDEPLWWTLRRYGDNGQRARR